MKKLFLFLLLCSLGFSQYNTSIDFELLEVRDGVYYKYNSIKPFSGKVFNIEGRSEGSIRNGKKNGKFVFYHENGQLKSEGYYSNNLQQRKWTYYYEKGQIKNGQIKNGQIKAIGSYKDGDGSEPGNTGIPRNGRIGLWKLYGKNGQLRLERNYKNGKFHGKYRTFYDSGQLENELSIENGIITNILSYYSNGSVSLESQRSKLDYTLSIFYENGQLFSSYKMKNDLSINNFDDSVIDFLRFYKTELYSVKESYIFFKQNRVNNRKKQKIYKDFFEFLFVSNKVFVKDFDDIVTFYFESGDKMLDIENYHNIDDVHYCTYYVPYYSPGMIPEIDIGEDREYFNFGIKNSKFRYIGVTDYDDDYRERYNETLLKKELFFYKPLYSKDNIKDGPTVYTYTGQPKKYIKFFSEEVEEPYYTLLFTEPSNQRQVISDISENEQLKIITLENGKSVHQYFKDGKLKHEGTFKGGKQDGLLKVYDENGQLKLEETYKNGELIDSKEY